MGQETITQTTAPWGPQQPYLQFGFGQAANLYNQGPQQYYPGRTYAPLSTPTEQGLRRINSLAMAGNPITDPAQQQIAGTLGVDYLNSNPYLDAMYDNAASAVTRNYSEAVAPGIQAQFANAGRAGSGLYANAMDSSRDTLSRTLGGMAANLYGGNYEAERTRQMQAAQMAPQIAQLGYLDPMQNLAVGQVYDNQLQKSYDENFNRYMYNQQAPHEALGSYMAQLGGNYGSQATSPYFTPSTAQNILGGALAGYRVGDALGGYGLLGALGGGLLGGPWWEK